MYRKEELTVQETFVGADMEQSNNKKIMDNAAEDKAADKQEKSLVTHSLTEILDATFQPQLPLIDGMLYEGTYLFAGSPKVGKSFMMAQIVYHVATGTDMWNMKVHKAPVLYLALEDTYSRIQRRLSRMFSMADADQLHFAIRAKMIHQGLEEQLLEFLNEHPDTKLVIIDTLQKVRKIGDDKTMYGSDYEVISRVKEIADRFHICVLFVHHTRKKKAADVFEEISGSQGLMGAADGAFVMKKKKRTSNQARCSKHMSGVFRRVRWSISLQSRMCFLRKRRKVSGYMKRRWQSSWGCII